MLFMGTSPPFIYAKWNEETNLIEIWGTQDGGIKLAELSLLAAETLAQSLSINASHGRVFAKGSRQ